MTTTSLRRTMTLAVLATLLSVFLVQGASAAVASNKSWTIGSYNVGAFDYSGFMITREGEGPSHLYDQSEYIDIEENIDRQRSAWHEFVDDDGSRRSTEVVKRISRSVAIDGDDYFPDVVAVQEASTSFVKVGTETPQMVNNLNSRLSTVSTSAKYGQAVNPAWFTALTGDAITVAGASTTRPIAQAARIYYNTSTLKVLTGGAYTGRSLLKAEYQAGYSAALGTTFASSSNRDKAIPWVILKTTGASSEEKNRLLVVSSLHSIVKANYAAGISDADVHFYNSETARGLAAKLNTIAAQATTSGQAHPAGIPAVIAGDFNAIYSTATRSNGDTAKSVPKLLHDYGYRDARTLFHPTTSPCTGTCAPYASFDNGGSKKLLDYIFTRYADGAAASTINVGDFVTRSDARLYSDHKAIVVRLKFVN